MGRSKTIDSFFKKKDGDEESKRQKVSSSEPELEPQQCENLGEVGGTSNVPQEQQSKDKGELDLLKNLERDPALRKPMCKYPCEMREKVRRAYLNLGPYQLQLSEYPNKGTKKHTRRFQYAWFSIFPNWLEYSPTTHSAYCFLCYLFSDKPSVAHGHDAFTVKGFDNWKKVNGKDCAFLAHIGSLQHKSSHTFSENLMNQESHIENAILKLSQEQIKKNRLRLKTTVDVVRWLTFQACALRGHDESITSKNRGNFLELLWLLASYNDEVAKVILGNAPYCSKYTSGEIQKEILAIIANKVLRHIRSEVGESPFCVMVDESRDESKKEQIAIVLRFIDEKGLIRERFLDLVHVSDTLSSTLFNSMWKQLENYQFDVSKIRGQGYDGASNMRGEWNGLQALVLKECPYAYYVHCFAHRLQLTLVTASREVIPVHQFFTNLVSIVNVVCASSKRHDELQKAKSLEIEKLLELGEIESGKGLNQVGTLRRPGDTRWGSHFKSICSLLNMWDVTRVVLKGIIKYKTHTTFAQRGDADAALVHLKSFEFVFILHLMKEIMGKTETLSQALQKKSQYILNAMELVSSTKESLNAFRNNGWSSFRDEIASLDTQLHELDSRFNEKSMELLSLSSSLMSKEINVDEISTLVERYYPADFTEQERIQLQYQLDIFKIDMSKNSKLSGVSTLASLCESLVEAKKRETFHLVDRLIRLILTLPVSTATTERSFSAMKIFKNRLRNKMGDEFLANSLVIYIEKELAESFDSESIIDEFKNLKGRRAEL